MATVDASRMLGVAADIGGTHARFAVACRAPDGAIDLAETRTLHTATFASIADAYEAYVAELGTRPARAAFAVAGPVATDEIKLTNSPWSFSRSTLRQKLRLDVLEIVNDFAAIAHALPLLKADGFRALSAETFALPKSGIISIVGPGSGLGVAMLVRGGARAMVLPCEGGHVSYAATDAFEQQLLSGLAAQLGHISAERFVCGEGLRRIYEAIAKPKTAAPPAAALWEICISGTDPVARQALERWLMMLGAFAGDMALAHGASAVVLAGGILPRFAGRIDRDALMKRFYAKGRLTGFMRAIPVALLNYPEPGLLGAASLLG
jgi:glucokinase